MKTTFRPTEAQTNGMKEIADEYGESLSLQIVMSWAVSALINHFRKHKGRLLTPVSLDETYEWRPLKKTEYRKKTKPKTTTKDFDVSEEKLKALQERRRRQLER